MKRMFCIAYLLCTLFSCSGNSQKDSAETSNQSIKIERFDIDLNSYLKNPTVEGQQELKFKYNNFLAPFGSVTFYDFEVDKPEYFEKMKKYFSNATLAKIYNDALEKFEDVSYIEQELLEADKYISKNFNGQHLPRLSMHVSGFKENTIVLENLISISSDKYLGSDYPLYQQFFENYQLIQMQPKMITRDYLKAWILSEIPKYKKYDLLTAMITDGIALHALSVILPEWEKTDLIGFTNEQMIWCKENEKNCWKSVVKQNHLFDDSYQMVNKYISDAPYTATISAQSPGRVGVWIGWQIVNNYMEQTGISLVKLLSIAPQEILKGSKYNP